MKMQSCDDVFVIMTTTPAEVDARLIGKRLIHEGLAACVQVISGSSYFWWDGEVKEATEYILFIKTHKDKIPEATQRIKELHQYKLPEILVIPVIQGNDDYLKWLRQTTSHDFSDKSIDKFKTHSVQRKKVAPKD